jgi:hypothetical protein
MTLLTSPQSCVVEIGAVAISLQSDNCDFLNLLRQRYSGFLSTSPAQFRLDFDLVNTVEASDDDVCVRRDAQDWLLERGDFRARWNPETGHGVVRQNLNPYSLDSVLRIVHSLILATRGGFLLHAASAICDGRAYLFSGVSGAGKTTLTRLAPPDVTLLTDEISYVRPGADGYAAFGTPFAGELARPGENCSAPLSTLFLLEKGPSNRVEEMSSADCMRRLMRNILFFAEDSELTNSLLATACEFVSRVPVRRLTFYPDSKVWDHIRQHEESSVHA